MRDLKAPIGQRADRKTGVGRPCIFACHIESLEYIQLKRPRCYEWLLRRIEAAKSVSGGNRVHRCGLGTCSRFGPSTSSFRDFQLGDTSGYRALAHRLSGRACSLLGIRRNPTGNPCHTKTFAGHGPTQQHFHSHGCRNYHFCCGRVLFVAAHRTQDRQVDRGAALSKLKRRKENAYFADGIQDDILTNLAKIGDLKVISRMSVMSYRGDGRFHLLSVFTLTMLSA